MKFSTLYVLAYKKRDFHPKMPIYIVKYGENHLESLDRNDLTSK